MNVDERTVTEKKREEVKRLLASYETLINECEGTFASYLYPNHPGSEHWDAPSLCRRHRAEDLPRLADAIRWFVNALPAAEQRSEHFEKAARRLDGVIATNRAEVLATRARLAEAVRLLRHLIGKVFLNDQMLYGMKLTSSSPRGVSKMNIKKPS